MTIPTMVSMREASKQSGLSYRLLRSLCDEDKIVYIKTGKKILINLDRLSDYLNGKSAED